MNVNARNIVEPLDLVAVSTSYHSKLTINVAMTWNENSFRYFMIKNDSFYENSYWCGYDDVDDLSDYFNQYGIPTSYIQGNYIEERVVPVSKNILTTGQQIYYDELMKRLT